MSEAERGLPAIYIDGETKTGKGAAGLAIHDALQADGLTVYYDVAGDFYRRYVAIVRQVLRLDEVTALPDGPALETAAAAVYASREPFRKDLELGDLQRQAISQSVAILSQLALVQEAGSEWWLRSAQAAVEARADVIVLDGRNPRQCMADATTGNALRPATVLDLYMTCTPEEAARRVLLTHGQPQPTPEQLAEQTAAVVTRREQDRHRKSTPFIPPVASIIFTPGTSSAVAAVAHSWQPQNGHELPLSITLDNTHLAKPDMLAAVADLAHAALAYEPGDQSTDKV